MMKSSLLNLRRGLPRRQDGSNLSREESWFSGIVFPNGIKCLHAECGVRSKGVNERNDLRTVRKNIA